MADLALVVLAEVMEAEFAIDSDYINYAKSNHSDAREETNSNWKYSVTTRQSSSFDHGQTSEQISNKQTDF